MADVFTNDLRIREQESGSNAGTWGGLLNTTIRNIASAFGQGSETIPNASTHTITLADGVADEARSMYLKCTGGGQACTVTLAPNTISKVWIISNETSFTLTFTQGSGANVAVAAGSTKMIVTDGAGSGAAVTDALSGLEGAFSSFATTGNAGIGVAAHASAALHITTANQHMRLNNGSELGVIQLLSGGELELWAHGADEVINFRTGGGSGTVAMNVVGTNVGIGASTVDANIKLQLEESDTTPLFLKTKNSAGSLIVGNNSAGNSYVSSQTSGKPLIFETENSERARITDSGIFLVGKNASGTANTGAELRSGVSNHAVIATSSAEVPVIVNRRDNDGSLISLFRNQVSVGNIGSRATAQGVTFNSEAADGVLQNAGSDSYGWNAGYFYPRVDNSKDLGLSILRWDDIFATNGTINTSDRNEKQDIEELSGAEKRVAVAAKALLRKYRWKDAVAEKGDDARIHVGIIAQDLQDAFTAEGLDAARYGMWCSDTWTNDDGSEQTRLSIRYSELLAFIISAI